MTELKGFIIDTPPIDNILSGKKACVMSNARLLKRPVAYEHPNGAVFWVNLDARTSQVVLAAAAS